jgi:fucose 4-O-acetylase-like acetyltransferase
MSFYFYYNTLKSKTIIKIKQRFQRILIPYIIWPIFIFIFNNILVKIFYFTKFQRKLKLKDLVLQLIFGFRFQVVFYYQFNLLFLTLIFTIISILSNNHFIIIFQIFLITAYLFQYSCWNKYIFKKYALAVRIPLGSFLELLPFAVAGTTLHYLDIIRKLKINKKFSIFFFGYYISYS